MRDEKLADVPEVADYLGVTRGWVYQKAASGELPSMRIGRYVKFSWPAIKAYLERQTREPVPADAAPRS